MGGAYAVTCADMGAAVAWVVPTYKNARPVWRFAERIVAPVAGKLKVNRSERIMEFPSGGWLGVYTADNDVSMRGEAFDVVIVDEAARVSEETYTDVILPTLADRSGRAMLISTPKGHNWFWQEFNRGLADGKHQASFTAPSSANPMPGIQRAAALARERVSDRTYRQEWLAEFLADGGGVFRRVAEAATATPQERAIEAVRDVNGLIVFPAHQYVIGADWGRTNDATVFKVIDVTAREECHSERMLQTDFQTQLTRLRALAERFNQPAIIGEYNSFGGPQVEALQNMGLSIQPFTTTNATKAKIIDMLALAFERGELRILNDPQSITELQAYESERLPSGLIRYGAPEGLHDDEVMALALAWYGASYAAVDLIAW